MGEDNKKSFGESVWEDFKAGFKPMGSRADERVKQMKQETGDQFAKDKAAGQMYMKQKFIKGFTGSK